MVGVRGCVGVSLIEQTRFDKLALRYEATIHIPAINEWL